MTPIIDFNNITVSEKDILDNNDLQNLLLENYGDSFTEDNQVIYFNSGDIDIRVQYGVYVSGTIDEDPGDYDTPPYIDVDIDVDIDIVSIHIDDVELEDISKELLDIILKKIQSEI